MNKVQMTLSTRGPQTMFEKYSTTLLLYQQHRLTSALVVHEGITAF